MDVKAEILAKLAEVEEMLLEAQCDGVQLAELACFADVNDKFAQLAATIDYYVD